VPKTLDTAIKISIWLLGYGKASRILIVPTRFNLYQLHRIIQAAFGWSSSDGWWFYVGGLEYGYPPGYRSIRGVRTFDAREVELRNFACIHWTRFHYSYNSPECGDWSHLINTWPGSLCVADTACCVDGFGARPPAHIKNQKEYRRFLRHIANPQHPKHASALAECGGVFDPKKFDVNQANQAVQKAQEPETAAQSPQSTPYLH
jgi:Plasmid pRiA4b ORF-3-like protein